MLKQRIKALARDAGVYHLARDAWRGLAPAARRQRARDCAFYRGIVGPDMLVFDIGGNLGQKAEIFLALGARTVIVEPNPHCRPVIEHATRRWRERAVIVEAAVGAEPGSADLHFVGTESTASLRADWPWLANGAPAQAVQSVRTPMTTLDALIAEHGRPDYIKIDVEGFELECLRGLSQPVPLISFEYHLEELAMLQACLDRLAALSAIRVNVIPMNGGAFLGSLWIEPAHLIERACGGLLPSVGDVFVMASSATQTTRATVAE